MTTKSKTDRIELRDLEIETIIGILPDERLNQQKIYVDLTLFIDLTAAAKSCDISHTVDYATLFEELKFVVQASQFLLLETAAFAIAHYVLAPPIGPTRTQIEKATISIRKPSALAGKGIPIVTTQAEAYKLTYEKAKGDGHNSETIFTCKDSIIQRIEMVEGRKKPPPINENYTFQDRDLKTSGPHFLRVYRL